MAAPLQAVRGMNDVLPDEAAHVGIPRGRCPRRVSPIRIPQHPHARRRADAAVRPRDRRSDRCRRKGDVHVRGQAQRREPDAASRSDRGHRPRRDRAQPDLRAPAARMDRGADVPPRAPAEGPLSPVPSIRRRGAGLRRARRRCRADRHARAAVAAARPRRRHRAHDEFARRPARAPRRTATRWSPISRSTRPSSTTIRGGASRTNPLRILDSKNPALAGADRRRAEDDRVASRDKSLAHFDALQIAARRLRRRRSRSTRGSCADSTITTARCSNG